MSWRDTIVDSPVEEQATSSWRDTIKDDEPVGALRTTPEPIAELQKWDEEVFTPATKETASDFYKGLEQGVTLSGADELQAGVMTGLEKGQRGLHRLFPSLIPKSTTQVDEELLQQGFTGDLIRGEDYYRQQQEQSESAYKEAEERSPLAYGTGEVVGALTSAIAMPLSVESAGLSSLIKTRPVLEAYKTAPTAIKGIQAAGTELAKRGALYAPLGALQGGLSSEADVIGAEQQQRQEFAQDVIGGAATGSVLGAVAAPVVEEVISPAIRSAKSSISSTIDDFVQDIPFLRQNVQAFGRGLEGRGYSGEKEVADFVRRELRTAENATNDLFKVQNQLGQEIETFLRDASDAGQKVTLDKNAMNDFNDVLALGKEKLGTNLYNRIASYKNLVDLQTLSPFQAWQFKRDLAKVSANMDDVVGNKLWDFSRTINNAINTSLSGDNTFKTLNKMYTSFADAGPETLVNKGVDQSIARKYLSDLSRSKAAVNTELEKIIRGVGDPGRHTDVAKRTLEEVKTKLTDFDRQFPGVLQRSGFDLENWYNSLKNMADEANISKTIRSNFGQVGTVSNLPAAIGARATFGISNIAGRTAKAASTPVNLGKKLAEATDQELTRIAEILTGSNKQNQTLGEQLMAAINNNDLFKRNAIIFTILQSPTARDAVYNAGFGGSEME